MDLGVRAQECDLATLFAPGEALCMPPYQRSYSWTDREALELFSDLRESTETGTPHFVGAIVLVRTDAGGALEIVDGQQRLTTLTILLAALRDLETDPAHADALHSYIGDPPNKMLGEAARWRLTLNHIDGPFFLENIQQRGSTLTLENESGESDSQGRMTGNALAFLKELRGMNDSERRALAEVVCHRCGLVRVTVSDRDQGYKVFRVLNTRGKEPNAHDIIKTDLFEKANFSVEEADHYARGWLEHEARLGGGAFDDLLQQIRFLFDKSPKGSLVNGFRKAVLQRVDVRTFLDDLLPRYVEAYEEITTGKVDLGDVTEAVQGKLNQLRALDARNWRAPAIKFLVDRRENPAKAPEFFDNLERLGYVLQLIVPERDQRNKRYRRVIDAIDNDKQLFSNSGPFAISRDEARKVRDRLLGRFGTFGQRRSMALRLNAALEDGEMLAPDADATVEHVLPRNVSEDSFWLTVWPDAKKRRDQADTLGNFVLLPRVLNQQADRLDFRQKTAIYFSGDETPFALTRDLKDLQSWTPDVVRKRTERLAEILAGAWGLL